jgi:hypothetical protein
MRNPCRTAAVVVSMLVSSSAFAASVQYDLRPTFEAALSSFVVYDFETASGFPLAEAPISGFAAGTVQTGSTGGPAFIRLYDENGTLPATNQALEGSSRPPEGLPVGDAFQPIQIVFKDAQHAVGFEDLDLGADEVAVMDVHFDGGLPDEHLVLLPAVQFANQFFGVISSDAIRGVTVYSADFGFDTSIGDRPNLIDNLTLGTPVPEPATAGLLALGVAAIATARRRAS